MKTITQLPYEIVVRHLLAVLPLGDLARVAASCRFFRELYKDEYLWQIKFLQDYRFYPRPTMCQFGWQTLYRAMLNVEVYTWGSNLDGRLGHGRKYRYNDAEYVPKRLRKLEGHSFIQLVSTGWGFHALDKDGRVWTWGRLAYESLRLYDNQPKMLTYPSDVSTLVGGRAVMLAKDRQSRVWQWHWENRPARVILAPSPSPCSNDQAAENSRLSQHHHHHYHNTSNTSKHDSVVKLAAGWDLCAVLTSSGQLYVWNHQPHARLAQYGVHPLKQIYLQHAIQLQDQGDLGARLANQGDKFVNVAAGLDFLVAVTGLGYVFKFTALEPHGSTSSSQQQHGHHNNSSNGHIHHGLGQVYVHGLGLLDHPEAPLIIDLEYLQAGPSTHLPMQELLLRDLEATDSPDSLPSTYLTIVCPPAVHVQGIHLAVFSKALQQSIAKHTRNAKAVTPAIQPSTDAHQPINMSNAKGSIGKESTEDPRLRRLRKRQGQEPRWMEHKHVDYTPFQVSAGYQKFSIFHEGAPLVLLGNRHAHGSTPPTVLSRLLDKPCEIALGDYHQGLLTEDGQLRTWGSFADGALGHGDLRLDMPIPTVVRGGGLGHKYIFRIAFAGWHSGCLAIELPEDGVFRGGGGGSTSAGITTSIMASKNRRAKGCDMSLLQSGLQNNASVDRNEDPTGMVTMESDDSGANDQSSGSSSSDGSSGSSSDGSETLVDSSSWSTFASSRSAFSSSTESGGFSSFVSKYYSNSSNSCCHDDDRVEFPRLALTRLSPELKVFDPHSVKEDIL
ncbi:hypothetical protein BGW41_007746 [Actinomortierella wolfii]|nr:hypothetical protein BGW41_007746 [Actinomortierella wolfii]